MFIEIMDYHRGEFVLINIIDVYHISQTGDMLMLKLRSGEAYYTGTYDFNKIRALLKDHNRIVE